MCPVTTAEHRDPPNYRKKAETENPDQPMVNEVRVELGSMVCKSDDTCYDEQTTGDGHGQWPCIHSVPGWTDMVTEAPDSVCDWRGDRSQGA
jgi:hypothetical protein